jgi:hypothetical protein
VTTLCRGIIARLKIPPHRVVAHSDTAPTRKQDPGEKFPWKVLADSGIGLWVPPAPIVEGQPFYSLGDRTGAIAEMQVQLREIGYGVHSIEGHYDGETMAVVAAFQRHYRPARGDGMADASTRNTLTALVERLREIKRGGAKPETVAVEKPDNDKPAGAKAAAAKPDAATSKGDAPAEPQPAGEGEPAPPPKAQAKA